MSTRENIRLIARTPLPSRKKRYIGAIQIFYAERTKNKRLNEPIPLT